MIAVLIGVIVIIAGFALSYILGPRSRKYKGIFGPEPSWWVLAKEFVVIVISWVMILAGLVFVVVGIFDFYLWVVSWL